MAFFENITLFLHTACALKSNHITAPVKVYDEKVVSMICDTVTHSLAIIGLTIVFCMALYYLYKIWNQHLQQPKKKDKKEKALSKDEISAMIQTGIDDNISSMKKAVEANRQYLDGINEIIGKAESLRSLGLDVSGRIKSDVLDIVITPISDKK